MSHTPHTWCERLRWKFFKKWNRLWPKPNKHYCYLFRTLRGVFWRITTFYSSSIINHRVIPSWKTLKNCPYSPRFKVCRTVVIGDMLNLKTTKILIFVIFVRSLISQNGLHNQPRPYPNPTNRKKDRKYRCWKFVISPQKVKVFSEFSNASPVLGFGDILL